MCCLICGREVVGGEKVVLNGQMLCCCNDPFCKEQLDDYLDNIGTLPSRKYESQTTATK